MEYRNERLGVCAKNAPLQDVLKEISKKTGLYIMHTLSKEERISIEFANQPLESGLIKLLRNENYSFFYLEDPDRDRKPVLSGLRLMGRGGQQVITPTLQATKDISAREDVFFPDPKKEWEEIGRQIDSFARSKDALELLSRAGDATPWEVSEVVVRRLEQTFGSKVSNLSALEELVKSFPSTR